MSEAASQTAGGKRGIITLVAVAMSLFHIFTGVFGVYEVAIQTGLHLSFAMLLIVLLRPSAPPRGLSPAAGRRVALGFDAFVAFAALAPMIYRFANLDYLTSGRFEFVTPVTPMEATMGLLLVLGILELCRRETGWPLVIIVAIVLAYPFASGLPWIFKHAGYSLGQSVDAQYLTLAGIFGIPLSASAEYIILFIIFGAFLERSGLGKLIMDVTVGMVGRYRGGPAKVAVLASAMHGTISGSAPANVLTVGVLTIPMMKRMGYPAYMAGAIEAAASTGGVIMPPVMGSVAFIMAQFIGVPYGMIALYAVIPAFLYFFGIFLTVHWSALKHDIGGLPAADLPDWRSTVKSHWHTLLPLLILIYMLMNSYSAQYSATAAIFACVVSSWARKHTRMGWREIVQALENGARGALMVAIATAAAGMIVGVFELTGIALKFTQVATLIVSSLFVGLVVTMVVTIILGMGVPPSASYIVQVAVTIPMLQVFLKNGGMAADTAMIVTHFFVMYYSALAVLTPPDALASVAAAGVAQAPFLKTGLHATRVAFVAFVVPFMFVYKPALLTLGTWDEIASALAIAMCGIAIISVAFEGFLIRRLGLLERLIAFAAGAALIFPSAASDVLGFGLAGLFLFIHLAPWRAARKASAAAAEKT
ncbi:MAG: TRAP transporter fused permease subunit [Beijerinckiaceae bacterium]|nr:TRAP transporter fused permease subunit [Beijerinckiaceae bacterium]